MEQSEIFKEVTQKIIEALKKGVGPWIKPWNSKGGPHRNAFTGHRYRGINVLLLNLFSYRRGFTSNLWLTEGQAERLGGYVKPGERGTEILFWKPLTIIKPKDEEEKETEEVFWKYTFIYREYTLFNLEQTEGVKPRVREDYEEDLRQNELGKKLLKLPRIKWGTWAAYYPKLDIIELPTPKRFNGRKEDHFYATFFHELVHWTGHRSRLNRKLPARFGDKTYAFEELVAEIGSAFLCTHAGITLEGLQHAEYINSWIKLLEEDRTHRAAFTAAGKAQKAVDWLLKQAPKEKEARVSEKEACKSEKYGLKKAA